MTRAERRALVRAWECERYRVETIGAPTDDDVIRSRELGRRRVGVDMLGVRARMLPEIGDAEIAARLEAIINTSSVAYLCESASYRVAWRYEDDADGRTPHDLVQAVRAARGAK